MLALLYDIHGNLPALDAVLADARAAGARRWLLGGDLVAFGGWPAEVLDRLDAELPDAVRIRGNTDRWLVDRHDLPADEPMLAAVLACREAIGAARTGALAALPGSAPLDAPGGGTAWHASPVSDMRSFLPKAADDEAELLAPAEGEPRLAFGHTHLQFRREAANGVKLVNPGSVGIPLDGDHRAAYAMLCDDGRVQLRRVDYDWPAARDAALEAAGGAPWGEIVAGRLERAAP